MYPVPFFALCGMTHDVTVCAQQPVEGPLALRGVPFGNKKGGRESFPAPWMGATGLEPVTPSVSSWGFLNLSTYLTGYCNFNTCWLHTGLHKPAVDFCPEI